MRKTWEAVKHGFKRVAPLLITGAGAIIASGSFRTYVEHHPEVATFVPVIVWLLHSLVGAKNTTA